MLRHRDELNNNVRQTHRQLRTAVVDDVTHAEWAKHDNHNPTSCRTSPVHALSLRYSHARKLVRCQYRTRSHVRHEPYAHRPPATTPSSYDDRLTTNCRYIPRSAISKLASHMQRLRHSRQLGITGIPIHVGTQLGLNANASSTLVASSNNRRSRRQQSVLKPINVIRHLTNNTNRRQIAANKSDNSSKGRIYI